MKPSEVFGIVVRSIGLLLLLPALGILFFAILNLALGGPGNVLGLIIIGLPTLLVGLWLLRGPAVLVSFAFPEESKAAARVTQSEDPELMLRSLDKRREEG